MRRFIIPLGVILVLLAGVIGFSARTGEIVKLRQYNEKLQVEKEKLQQEYVKVKRDEKVALFFLADTGSNAKLKPVLVPVVNGRKQPAAVLQALFDGPPPDSGLLRLFPPETKVLGVTVKDGLATVNLNQKAAQLNLGAQGEAMAVASVVNTLTKLPEIFRVKILVEGDEVESLGGHVDLYRELEYDSQAVSY
jgi:spore germination protein GerM